LAQIRHTFNTQVTHLYRSTRHRFMA